jgi:hypothetical protein
MQPATALHKYEANMVTNKASASKLRQMLFPPTLGFGMKQYFLTEWKPIYLGKSGYAWVANTLGEYNPINGKERK